jgi:hypothetical protein
MQLSGHYVLAAWQQELSGSLSGAPISVLMKNEVGGSSGTGFVTFPKTTKCLFAGID